MKPIERVQAALAGHEVDRAPFSFWHPFGLQHMEGEALAAATLAFGARFGVDWLRVDRCHDFTLPGRLRLDRPHDYTLIEPIHGRNGNWARQLDALQRISKAAFGKRWVVDTVPSPWTLCEELSSPELMRQTRLEHPGFLRQALEALTRSLASYARCLVEVGAQGLVLQLSGNRHPVMTPKEYAEWGWPFDCRVLEAAASAPFNSLQLGGPRPHFVVPSELPIAAVSWSVATGPGLRRSPHGWSGAIIGGLDETRLGGMSAEALSAYLEELRSDLRGPVLLAPGDALPVTTSPPLLERLCEELSAVPRRSAAEAGERPPRHRAERERPAPANPSGRSGGTGGQRRSSGSREPGGPS